MPMIVDTPVTVQTKVAATAPAPTQAAPTSTTAPDGTRTVAADPVNDPNQTRTGFTYKPMKLTGILDQYEKAEVTPHMGTEFKNVSLREWITGPDSDAHIRDLGVLISRRGVVSFRKQTDMTDDLQRELCQRLGKLTNQPEGHGMYEHPMNMIRGDERDMQTLDVVVQKKTHFKERTTARQSAASEWHSDVPAEVCPASYTMLRMTHIPKSGSDTMFCDGYGLYERLSEPYKRFAQSLEGYYYIAGLNKAMNANIDNPKLNLGPRGAPDNVGVMGRTIHPVVRTNPVTGWKSLYHPGLFYDGIVDFTEIENRDWDEKIMNLVTRNHDLQLRYKWNDAGDMAIWDNRSTLHAATQDYTENPDFLGARLGRRCLSTGERPFYDPESIERNDEVQGLYA